MKKILIIILISIFSISLINAQDIKLDWTVKSVTGSGDKCQTLKGNMPIGKIISKDYAMISIIPGNVNVNSCSSATAVIILESNSFKLNSNSALINMFLPTYSGSKYEIGIDNSNFQLLENIWQGVHTKSQFNCIKNSKQNGNTPIFSTYKINTNKFSDKKSHKLTIRVSKLDSKCPLAFTSKSTISTSTSKSTSPISSNNANNNNVEDIINTDDVINQINNEMSGNSFFKFFDDLISGSTSLSKGAASKVCPYGYSKVDVIDGESYCKSNTCNNLNKFEDINDKEKVEFSKKSVGSISSIKGRVFIERGIKTLPASIGFKIYANDKINVEENSQASVILGGEELKVTEKTSFQIPNIWRHSNREKSSFNQLFDKLWCKTKIILKGDTFEIKTPTATAGVRG